MGEPVRDELEERLRAAEETIKALKGAALARQEERGEGGMAGIHKAMANLQNSLAERRRELEATMGRYRALFDHSPLMGLTLDAEGFITTANRTIEECIQLPGAASLVGAHWKSLFEADAIEPLRALLAGDPAETHDLRLVGGKLVEAVVAQVPGHGETQLLLHDVTEHRSVEERLRHSQKMDALGQLAGGVAHDFNNLLSAIIGYTELMQANPDGVSVTNFTAEVLSASHRAADLVSHLLAFSRSEPASLSPLGLNAIADNVARIASRTFDRRITVEADLRAAHDTVSGDSALLESAILNLAINARDAMPEGGTLRITTTNVPLPREVVPRKQSNTAAKAIELCIEDDGEGMDPDVLARMFDPFFTTKPQGKGTGLGLAATYGTVKRHKGTIRVHSSPGRGTRFCIYLPLTESANTEPTQAPPSNHAALRVLVVDDEPAVRRTTRLLLESLGHEVETAEDATTGLATLAGESSFGLVLLDLMLPDMHGNEVLAQLRAAGNPIPVLVISGYSPTECGPGADGFLRKPFTRAELNEAIAVLTAPFKST
jgi:signal transduction histidine kinase/CheY-like chemotaxis protein